MFRTTPPRPPTAYDCDFETDECSAGWTIKGQPELTWTRTQGATASQVDQHNPLYDHTGNHVQGHYLSLTPTKSTPFPDVRKKVS